MLALRTACAAVALCAAAAPQDPPPAAADPVVTRAAQDLAAAAHAVAADPHAFAGRLAYEGSPNDELASFEYAFTGAAGAAFDWFTLDEWCTARCGARTIVRRAQGTWSKPQGDSPDLPLSPRLFAAHLPRAALARPEPSEFRGRPALRVHATWRGEAAKAMVRELAVPSTKHAALLQAFGTWTVRVPERCVVDASVRYDPASRRWLATTLRCVCLDGRPLGENQPPLPSPTGLPALDSPPLFAVTIELERRELDALPAPDLDPDARALLGLGKD